MAKKRQELTETVTTIMINGKTFAETDAVRDLRVLLSEIRKRTGVIGYILKEAATATVNLQDSAKTVEYAMLASEAFDSYADLLLFDMGEPESILIDCKNLKVLCVVLGERTVSIFMEKTADSDGILKEISALANSPSPNVPCFPSRHPRLKRSF
jgi:hypothetical protein